MHVAVIGCGFGAQHLNWISGQPTLKIDTLCFRSRADRARALADQFGVPQISDDPAAVLRSGEIDLAVIVTPPDTRQQLVPIALAAGAHVFVDKPLSNTVAAASELTDLAAGASGQAAVNFQWRMHPAFQQLRALLAGGQLGTLRRVHVRFFHNFFRGQDPSWDWRFDQSAAGGGALGDLGVHCFDLLHWLVPGQWQVFAAATSAISQPSDVLAGAPADDLADVWLREAGSRCLATMSMSRIACGPHLVEFVIQGDDGTVALSINPDDASASLSLASASGAAERTEFGPTDLNPYPQLLSLLSDTPDASLQLASFADGLAAQLRLAEAQELAGSTGH